MVFASKEKTSDRRFWEGQPSLYTAELRPPLPDLSGSAYLLQRSLGNSYLQAIGQTGGHTSELPLIQRAWAPGGSCASCRYGEDGQEQIQPKLVVGAPDDVYEQEADRVAEQVMRMPAPALSIGRESAPPAQRSCSECQDELKRQSLEEKDEQRLQAQSESGAVTTVSPGVENAIHALSARGQPLPESVRSFTELRFSADFSAVRIHTDLHAHDLARSVNAQAFTVGQDIVFRAGHYVPETTMGKHLLAHELTHVLQQRGNDPFRTKNSTLSGPPGLLSRKRFRGPRNVFECRSIGVPCPPAISSGALSIQAKAATNAIQEDKRQSYRWVPPVAGCIRRQLATVPAKEAADAEDKLTEREITVAIVHNGHRALAFTHGKDIYLSEGMNDFESSEAKQMVAHELTHTIQQRAAGSSDSRISQPGDIYEQETDRAADDVMRTPEPNYAPAISECSQSLHLQKHPAKPSSEQEELLDLLIDPVHNHDKILRLITKLGKDVERIGQLLSRNLRFFEDLAGTNQGIDILQSLIPHVSPSLRNQIISALRRTGRKASEATRPEDLEALNKINLAIRQDLRLTKFLEGRFPLRFPATLYDPVTVRDGGIYYDPKLVDTGLVPMYTVKVGLAGGRPLRSLMPILYVKIGPSALSSNLAYLQSVLFHEFTHFTQGCVLRKRESDMSTWEKLTKTFVEASSGGRNPDLEVETHSMQLAGYFFQLEKNKAAHIMEELTRYAVKAQQFQWQDALDRVKLAVRQNPRKKSDWINVANMVISRTRKTDSEHHKKSLELQDAIIKA